MATDKIELEIVTPRGLALRASVDEVTAPSVKGEFGVMPGHVPVLAAMRTGVVTYRQAGEQKKFAIGEGLAEGGPHKLLILAEDFIERDDVDPVAVRAELAEVQTRLEKLTHMLEGADEQETKKLITRESWLAAQLELIGDPPPPTMNPVQDFSEEDEPVEGTAPAEGGEAG